MAPRTYSSIYNDLEEISKKRYSEKLDLLGDSVAVPYVLLESASSTDSCVCPAVEYPDI